MVSIKTKLIAISLIISLVPMLILGVINLNKTTDILTDSVEDALDTIVKSKEAALESYIIESEKNGKSFADTDVMQEYISYLDKELSVEETAEFEQVKKEVDNLLYSFMEAHWGVEYHHLFIADASGEIILSPNHGENEKGSPSSHLNSDISENPWFEAALDSTQVTDYSTWAESNHFHQLLLYPVKDSEGVTKAVIGFELMISHEQEILSKGFNLGETGKVYLSSLDNVPVVHLKDDLKPASSSQGISEAIKTGSSIGRTVNEDGVDVIGFYLKNEKYPWVMVAEVEEAEAFQSIGDIRSYFAFGLVLTAILVSIIAVVLSGYISRPIKQLSVAAQKLTDGNFDIELPALTSKDEISELAGGMQMLASVVQLQKGKKK